MRSNYETFFANLHIICSIHILFAHPHTVTAAQPKFTNFLFFFLSLSEESKWVYVEYALGYSNPLNFFLNTNKLVDISPYFMQNATFQFKYDCVSHMNAGHVSLIANML